MPATCPVMETKTTWWGTQFVFVSIVLITSRNKNKTAGGILFPRLFPCFLFETETYSRLLRGFALFPTQKQNKIEWLDFVFDSEYGKLLPPPTTIKGEVRI